MHWRKLSGEPLAQPIGTAVESVIKSEREKGIKLKICIGTDSQVKKRTTQFATVIVFLRPTNGGFMYIYTEQTKHAYPIKERMLIEVAKSIEIAYQLCDILLAHKIDVEIHADINTQPNFKSYAALKDAMGYISNMGFTFKAKPEAFASSSCADKICN